MRQITAREEAAMIGGIGMCGREICCRACGGRLPNVGMKMAKEQNLSLSPSKTGGVCGRLMCCMRFEYEAYREFNKRCPKVGCKVDTPNGPGKISATDMPKEQLSIRIEGETKPRKVRLEDVQIERDKQGKICKVSIDEAALNVQSDSTQAISGTALERFDSDINDTLSDGSVHVHHAAPNKNAHKDQQHSGRSRSGSGHRGRNRKRSDRSGSGQGNQNGQNTGNQASTLTGQHLHRRRHGSPDGTSGGSANTNRPNKPKQGSAPSNRAPSGNQPKHAAAGGAPRPGRFSSSVHVKPRRHHEGSDAR
jgi:hypothetical protein